MTLTDPDKVKVDSLDSSKYRLVPVQMLEIAVRVSGDPIMRNTVAIGSAMKIIGIDRYVEVRRKMMRKRMTKIDTMLKNEKICKDPSVL